MLFDLPIAKGYVGVHEMLIHRKKRLAQIALCKLKLLSCLVV